MNNNNCINKLIKNNLIVLRISLKKKLITQINKNLNNLILTQIKFKILQ